MELCHLRSHEGTTPPAVTLICWRRHRPHQGTIGRSAPHQHFTTTPALYQHTSPARPSPATHLPSPPPVLSCQLSPSSSPSCCHQVSQSPSPHQRCSTCCSSSPYHQPGPPSAQHRQPRPTPAQHHCHTLAGNWSHGSRYTSLQCCLVIPHHPLAGGSCQERGLTVRDRTVTLRSRFNCRRCGQPANSGWLKSSSRASSSSRSNN